MHVIKGARLLCPLGLALIANCGDSSDAAKQSAGAVSAGTVHRVIVVSGNDVPDGVHGRLIQLLTSALPASVTEVTENAIPGDLDSDSLVLAVGDSAVTRNLISDDDLHGTGAEGYVVRAGRLGPAHVLAARGNPQDPARAPHGNVGAGYATYAALEELGFAFLHPLAPVVPAQLAVSDAAFRKDAPRWPVRAVHIHTQHPLELTELLQGWGPAGPNDEAGFTAMLPEWDRYLEWLVANGQNRVEWFLLEAASWQSFARSDVRQARLKRLVDAAHRFGVGAGVDVPISFAQQHAMRLLPSSTDPNTDSTVISTALDWVMGSGFDFLGTEAGTSEFTHPTPENMLSWMNTTADYTATKFGKPTYIKIHCSTGQTAPGYPDPKTGQPINFNMLPHFASRNMGVLPHTVETYSLDDPAPTYGNTNFDYIRQFLRNEVGGREVLFYPESAYWVSYDDDVPLFLPLYADRRVHDLRLIAQDENAGLVGHAGTTHMDGQLLFSSGWEWGYWLNDVIAARAAWAPQDAAISQTDALIAALAPVVRPFGDAADDVRSLLVDWVTAEQALLIDGKVGGISPKSLFQRTGHGYLEGFDTWDDVSKLAGTLGISGVTMTQPDRIGLVDLRNPLNSGPNFSKEVQPLLQEMEATFGALADRTEAIAPRIPPAARDLYDDIADAARVTALRARQIRGLYEYVAGHPTLLPLGAGPASSLSAARDALDQAAVVVARREPRYRVPLDRIAGWRAGPTAYNFGYLWSVHSLHYWWRDEGKAVDHPLSPCYMNIINPVDVGFGEGHLKDILAAVGSGLSSNDQRGCLAEPSAEPVYPSGGLRGRP